MTVSGADSVRMRVHLIARSISTGAAAARIAAAPQVRQQRSNSCLASSLMSLPGTGGHSLQIVSTPGEWTRGAGQAPTPDTWDLFRA